MVLIAGKRIKKFVFVITCISDFCDCNNFDEIKKKIAIEPYPVKNNVVLRKKKNEIVTITTC